jgi:hypothetical protein
MSIARPSGMSSLFQAISRWGKQKGSKTLQRKVHIEIYTGVDFQKSFYHFKNVS